MSKANAARSEATEACSALRRTLQAAGINCSDPVVDDADGRLITHIKYMAGPAAATMAALLRAGSDLHAEAPPSPPYFVDLMSREETVPLRDKLAEELARVGVDGLTPVVDHPRGGGAIMHIKDLEIPAVTKLTSLLDVGMREYVATAEVLHGLFLAHGLDAYPPLPEPAVAGLHICLGEISVHGASVLGALLDGGPATTEVAEIPDFPEAKEIMKRLSRAVAVKTSGGFVDFQLHPSCQKCNHFPTIALGDLKLSDAKRLVTALQSAQAPTSEASTA